ncbi:cation:proton antiporter [Mesobacterium pallidum]|uniref:cation:proton antiporter n=1 Tax=Mesobacterium pallidum TaxID=2872037 RepID=UPI001EE2732B|nr:cation:proton antiporter [Mesobacterium pallidum]
MMGLGTIFITLGALFLCGLVADQVGRRTMLPRVTLLLGLGLLVGSAGFDLLPPEVAALYDFLSVAALTMVAFLLGGALTRENMAAHGKAILWISLCVVLVTVPLVAGALWLVGLALPAALALGAIAAATDPAATEDSLRQAGAKGPFAETLRGVVAIDDAWGMIVFSLVIVLARIVVGEPGEAGSEMLAEALVEIAGSLALGAAVGFPAAYLTGRLTPGEPQQSEALGVVCLTAGFAIWLDLSFLLAGMAAGTVIVNMARHHDRAFHEIEHVQWPFMILFFILAGASLEAEALAQVGLLGVVYSVGRIVARVIGGWAGARLGQRPRAERAWYGTALLPQAGVAVGMALVAAQELPMYGDLILTMAVATTVVFELIGPVATFFAARQVAKVSKADTI